MMSDSVRSDGRQDPGRRFRILVLGAGPAGYSAALQAAKLGLDVGVVERNAVLGGACVNTGTLPSKTLRHTIEQLVTARRVAHLGLRETSLRPLTIQDLMGPTQAVISHHEFTIRGFLERNGVTVIPGSASFVSPNQVRVANRAGEEIIGADHVVIATGSRPRRPDSLPFDDRVICDSDGVLSLDHIPRSLTVMGGGVIGCEYASMFAALGVRVTLVDRHESILRFLDKDVIDTLLYALTRAGVRLILGEEMESASIEGDSSCLRLRSGRLVRSERLLVAAGRASNVDALGLDRAGVIADDHGLVKVDEMFRTTGEGIYAVGDVVGFPALASTSMLQGRRAVLDASGVDLSTAGALPIALYTMPEISAVGLTEEECRAQAIPYEVGVARYAETPRGQILGGADGLLKLIIERSDRRLIGVHLIGAQASELIHTGALHLAAGGSVDALAAAVFNYPTLSELYRIAALDCLNRL